MRKSDLNTKNQKEPFEWGKVLDFLEAYGVRHPGYCHSVVATMTVVMFGGMCRYDDASELQWKNIRFVEDGSGFEITFDKRKNAHFRPGNKVLVAANPSATVCPLRLLRELRILTGGSEDLFIFRGLDGRLVSKRPGFAALGPDTIT